LLARFRILGHLHEKMASEKCLDLRQ
jgi:hypothetical protein